VRKVTALRTDVKKGKKEDAKEIEDRFLEAINDDLNMPRALEVFWGVLDDTSLTPITRLSLLEAFDEVLGLGVGEMKEAKNSIPKSVLELARAREQARKEKRWADSDRLRDEIRSNGFLVEDMSKGFELRKI
jgi:cysteinyl-tRNA synthetase